MQKLISKSDIQCQSLRYVSFVTLNHVWKSHTKYVNCSKKTINVSLDSKSFKSLISISAIIQLENYWGILKTVIFAIIKSSGTLIDHTLCFCSIKVFHRRRKSNPLICGLKHKCLECTYRLCQFSKVVVVTSAPWVVD